jgi:hypothetical protein
MKFEVRKFKINHHHHSHSYYILFFFEKKHQRIDLCRLDAFQCLVTDLYMITKSSYCSADRKLMIFQSNVSYPCLMASLYFFFGFFFETFGSLTWEVEK